LTNGATQKQRAAVVTGAGSGLGREIAGFAATGTASSGGTVALRKRGPHDARKRGAMLLRPLTSNGSTVSESKSIVTSRMHKDNWRSGAHVVVADFDDPQTIRACGCQIAHPQR
jgi:NAD(P)-dependent dehydrogenase (short-subunit alcohol dehydrogenase family)